MLVSRLGAFDGLAVADIFAGTGALGLEALSRGATSCVFVEQERDALAALRANIAALNAPAEVLPIGVANLGRPPRPCDLLLFDPPYGSGGAGALIERLSRLGWAVPGAWASVETSRGEQVSAEGWTLDTERTHGKAKLSLLVRSPAAPPG